MNQESISQSIAIVHPITLSHGMNAEVWDTDGKRYIDFVGGIGVLNVGHNHPRVVEAVRRQVGEISHASFQVVAYASYIDVAARLNAMVGGGEAYKSVLFTSGAEAVENAVKIARGYTNRTAVISFRGGFHGRTWLGVTLTGMSQPYKQNFGPFPAEIYHATYPNAYRGVSSDDALAEQQQSFRQLHDEVRRLRAQTLLDSGLAIREVARACGFAELSPFYRAFRRWYGQTPEQYRQRHSAADLEARAEASEALGQ